MITYRVLWTDKDGTGRWTDVNAIDMHAAIWDVAIESGDSMTSFVAILDLSEGE